MFKNELFMIISVRLNALEIAHILGCVCVQMLMHVNLQTPWFGSSQFALQLMFVWRSRIWSQVDITSSELEPATPGASALPVNPPTWSLCPAVVSAAHTPIRQTDRQTLVTMQTYIIPFKFQLHYILCLKHQRMMELESSGKTILSQHLQRSVKLEGKCCCSCYCCCQHVLCNQSNHALPFSVWFAGAAFPWWGNVCTRPLRRR